jgi:hypothetical protein
MSLTFICAESLITSQFRTKCLKAKERTASIEQIIRFQLNSSLLKTQRLLTKADTEGTEVRGQPPYLSIGGRLRGYRAHVKV